MSGKQKTVLLIEDDALISEALTDGLKQAGFKVINAFDGDEGLALALKHHPDLILLDLMMPKKSGHEVLEELRKDTWGQSVPITVLTNATDNIDIFLATKHPHTTYAVKSSMKLQDIINMAKARTS
jgi:two-component system alkaline phosphatase synthesis response regulator PhoP